MGDPESHRHEGELAQFGVGSMRRLVFTPTTFDGRLPDDLLSAEQFNVDDGCNGAMDSGYYTDLLVNDDEDSQDHAPPSDPTIHRAPAAATSSQGRSKNFRDEEDIFLVLAWLNVGMDPILEVDQSHGTYWRRIHEYFHGNKKYESNRT
ncbi:hypothetical protein GQ55_1G107300 [Panicum hallii var. hallii]|uniref:No apical meristem-associated C-terminal domain-containing protein n=1 Tax=Panicum hallii var. hallii TaxID=1504633 RepID=A0A2T7F4D9_9POAL|nr:hypothetical protein GQ55_1G107300 [Panicum hallii var. hallii]